MRVKQDAERVSGGVYAKTTEEMNTKEKAFDAARTALQALQEATGATGLLASASAVLTTSYMMA